MDNSMSEKNIEVSNSIHNLSFIWKALFSDGKIIEQFENGIENRFQEVKDSFDKLIRFSLVNKDYSQCFVVDLQNGFIIYNNYRNIEIKEKKENIRLVFFRRHRIEIEIGNLKEKKHEIFYFLGYQYNDKSGKNQKIILQIDSEGNWILLGE